jgi:hypothetical protein
MRTLSITLVSAVVFLLVQQLTAAADRPHRGKVGVSQAVVAGDVACFPDGGLNAVTLRINALLGVVGSAALFPGEGLNLGRAVDLAEECSDLIPAIAEQVPHRVCEIGNNKNVGTEAFSFVCTGSADAVISAVGKLAKAVTRLGQP